MTGQRFDASWWYPVILGARASNCSIRIHRLLFNNVFVNQGVVFLSTCSIMLTIILKENDCCSLKWYLHDLLMMPLVIQGWDSFISFTTPYINTYEVRFMFLETFSL